MTYKILPLYNSLLMFSLSQNIFTTLVCLLNILILCSNLYIIEKLMIRNQYMLVSGHFLIPENIVMLTLFTSIKSLSLGMKLLELTDRRLRTNTA